MINELQTIIEDMQMTIDRLKYYELRTVITELETTMNSLKLEYNDKFNDILEQEKNAESNYEDNEDNYNKDNDNEDNDNEEDEDYDMMNDDDYDTMNDDTDNSTFNDDFDELVDISLYKTIIIDDTRYAIIKADNISMPFNLYTVTNFKNTHNFIIPSNKPCAIFNTNTCKLIKYNKYDDYNEYDEYISKIK